MTVPDTSTATGAVSNHPGPLGLGTAPMGGDGDRAAGCAGSGGHRAPAHHVRRALDEAYPVLDDLRGTTCDYRPASPELRDRVERLAEICDQYDVPLKAAAMRYPATHPAVTTVLIGCATAVEVRENADLWNQPIPDDLWSALHDACQ